MQGLDSVKRNRLGLSTHAWWLLGRPERLRAELEAIAEAGADTCELILQGIDVVCGGRLVPARVRAVREIMGDYPLAYTLHLPYELNLLCQTHADLYKRVFLSGVEFAREAGIEAVVFHASHAPLEDKDAPLREPDILRELCRSAGDIPICMENSPYAHPGEYCAEKSVARLEELCREVGCENFGLTLDVGHRYLSLHGDGAVLLRDIKALLPFLRHVHLHDNFGLNQEMKEHDEGHRIACGAFDLHLPLGWGTIPIPAIVHLLSEGYTGIINLEIEKRFEDQYRESLSHVRKFWFS